MRLNLILACMFAGWLYVVFKTRLGYFGFFSLWVIGLVFSMSVVFGGGVNLTRSKGWNGSSATRRREDTGPTSALTLTHLLFRKSHLPYFLLSSTRSLSKASWMCRWFLDVCLNYMSSFVQTIPFLTFAFSHLLVWCLIVVIIIIITYRIDLPLSGWQQATLQKAQSTTFAGDLCHCRPTFFHIRLTFIYITAVTSPYKLNTYTFLFLHWGS